MKNITPKIKIKNGENIIEIIFSSKVGSLKVEGLIQYAILCRSIVLACVVNILLKNIIIIDNIFFINFFMKILKNYFCKSESTIHSFFFLFLFI